MDAVRQFLQHLAHTGVEQVLQILQQEFAFSLLIALIISYRGKLVEQGTRVQRSLTTEGLATQSPRLRPQGSVPR
jgi:hypothetical protein